MTLGLSDEDRELRDSVRGWAARHATPDVIRTAVEAKTEARPTYWSSFAELGMLGLHLPEEVGGAGFGLLETAIVAEELGRAMVPGPFLPTVIVSAVLDEAGRRSELDGLADGSLFGAVACSPGTCAWSATAIPSHSREPPVSPSAARSRMCSCSRPTTVVSGSSSS